jgi:serine/threonine-protein kinase
MAMSWSDATAFAAWVTSWMGSPTHVAPELWWEKAARGVDARFYPWGDRFDPSLCKMRSSRSGRPMPEPVGTFQTDVSVYGMRDIAGTIREWCGEASFDGIPDLRPVRGGSWHDHPRHCRLAARHDFEPWLVRSQVGFRLARPCP